MVPGRRRCPVAVGAIGVGVLGAPMAGAVTKDTRNHKPPILSRTSPVVIVAEQSRANVVELHELAVSAGRTGMHPGTIPASAKGLEASLRSELATVNVVHPKASSANGILEGSLTSYLGLATTLGKFDDHVDEAPAELIFHPPPTPSTAAGAKH